MSRTTAAIVVIAVLGAAAGYWFGTSWQSVDQTPAGLQVVGIGDPLPEIRLPQLDGIERSLDEFRGRPLLINYWATWCEPCVRELPLLNSVAHGQAMGDLVVVGIAQDQPAAVQRFLRRVPVDYAILIETPGTDDSAQRLGNARDALPYSVLVGADGRLLATHLGVFDEDQLRAWLVTHLP